MKLKHPFQQPGWCPVLYSTACLVGTSLLHNCDYFIPTHSAAWAVKELVVRAAVASHGWRCPEVMCIQIREISHWKNQVRLARE